MNQQVDLNEKSFLLYAMRHYNNPHCHDIEEFNEDLSTTIHLKKLFTRYHSNGVLKERLIINHLIGFFNVFDPLAAAKILFFKIDQEHHIYLKTFLKYLNRCPDIMLIHGKKLDTRLIKDDTLLMSKLKNSENRNAGQNL